MSAPAEHVDIAVAWNWAYDREFLQLLDSAAAQRGLTTLFIDHQNLAGILEKLRTHSLTARIALDRASDEDERFHPLASLLQRRSSAGTLRLINPYDRLRHASDKASMHLEFLSHGLHVPYTIIISPYNHKKEVELSLTELSKLGRPFIIKPANTTGGGIGVVVGAESLKDIIDTRQHHKNDKYLLQEKIVPAMLGEHRAWFRVFYAFGRTLPCWWDDQTHLYKEVTPDEEGRFNLAGLRRIAVAIHEVCGLDFFSTEVAFTPNEQFVVVDYVNEMCDMRLKSLHEDGVPDPVVEEIVAGMVEFAAGIKEAES